MGHQLTVWWVVWWVGAALLTLGWVMLNARRRQRLLRSGDEATRTILPTLREDLLWGALTVLGGGAGLLIILFLLKDGHTARGLLAAAIFGLIMLLGLLMVLKNGLAPTDVLRLDGAEPPAPPSLDAPEAAPVDGQSGPDF